MATSAIPMGPIAAPFLHEPDFTSPSLSSAQLQGSTNSPLFDSVDIHPPSPRLPHTPSYNGSYQNSPYTTYSELSYSGGQDLAEPLGLFDDPLSRGTLEEYNPSEYDAPNSGGLLMFDMGFMNAVDNNDPQITLAVSPPADSPYDGAGSPYSHPSPGSSNGHEGLRSRNSSVSSNHHAASAPATMPDFSHQFDHMDPFSPTSSQKPQSPPRLIIQDSSSPANTHFPPPPVINAPEGDAGGLSGPQLNVVPATPVSGGGAVDPTAIPFQTMESIHQRAAQPSWNPQAGQPTYNYGLAGGVSPHMPQTSLTPAEANYLQASRTRRRSEGNMIQPAPGMWTIQPDEESTLLDDNVNLLAFTPGSSPGSTASFHTAAANGMSNHMMPHPQRPPHMVHNYTFGPPSSTAAHLGPGSASNSTGLSPHLSANLMLGSSPHMSPSHLPGQFLSPMDGAVQLRRARSDGSRGHRQVRSEDFNNFTPGVQQEYPQFLAPDIGLSGMARAGHMRRASSGSRSDRGLNVMQGGVVPGMWGNSARSSPYPSPNASPRGPVDNIPLPDVSIRRGQRPSNIQTTDEHGVVKQNVTTHATKDASEKRRKVEAAFVCPVPGCGSTFTRHFNLKGHMRSHNEEKPYQCKWPGCPKSFARQHDCRRHENLHLNIRPFTCDGCKKTFARMDALNRHLRSEGGLECQKTQTEFPGTGGDDLNQQMQPGDIGENHYSLGMPKAEADGWSTGGFMM